MDSMYGTVSYYVFDGYGFKKADLAIFWSEVVELFLEVLQISNRLFGCYSYWVLDPPRPLASPPPPSCASS